MTNRSGTLYIGVTNDIIRRAQEHRLGGGSQFTRRYKMDRLLYVESTPYVLNAIEREKQLKGWTRTRKLELILASNPTWRDLSEEWFGQDFASVSTKAQILRSAQHDKPESVQAQGSAHV
jgi:putative endonuclease